MKRVLLSAVVAGLVVFGSCGSKSQITKRVKMEIIDGQEELTITTTENGKETVQQFSGAEARKKMKEMEKEELNMDGEKIEKKIEISEHREVTK